MYTKVKFNPKTLEIENIPSNIAYTDYYDGAAPSEEVKDKRVLVGVKTNKMLYQFDWFTKWKRKAKII